MTEEELKNQINEARIKKILKKLDNTISQELNQKMQKILKQLDKPTEVLMKQLDKSTEVLMKQLDNLRSQA